MKRRLLAILMCLALALALMIVSPLKADTGIVPVAPAMLPVYNQGSEPWCVYYTETEIASALLAEQYGYTVTLDPVLVEQQSHNWSYFDSNGVYHDGVDIPTPWGATYRLERTSGASTPTTPLDYADISAALKAGYYLDMSIPITYGWDSSYGASTLDLPDTVNAARGWHDATIIGADTFGALVRNSWGSGWGQGGSIWVSWAWLQKFDTGSSAWTLDSPVVKPPGGAGMLPLPRQHLRWILRRLHRLR